MFQISLEAARVNAKMTQKEAASAMKFSPTTLIRWENGKAAPSVVQFRKLCSLYNCPEDIVFVPENVT